MANKSFSETLGQLLRYAILGLTLNIIGYLIYLSVTALGVSPLTTVTFFYPLSILAGYFAHQRHTFQRKAQNLRRTALIRYVLVYVAGYLVNAVMLEVLHRQMGYPHQMVQLVAIPIVAALLFIAMKFFVFRKSDLAVVS